MIAIALGMIFILLPPFGCLFILRNDNSGVDSSDNSLLFLAPLCGLFSGLFFLGSGVSVFSSEILDALAIILTPIGPSFVLFFIANQILKRKAKRSSSKSLPDINNSSHARTYVPGKVRSKKKTTDRSNIILWRDKFWFPLLVAILAGIVLLVVENMLR